MMTEKERKQVKKRLISFVMAMTLCFGVTGIFPAFAEGKAPVRVGELTWLLENSAERSATLAEIQEKIAGLTGSGEQEESEERNLYSCEKEIICYDTLDSMLMALQAGEIDAAGLYSSVCRYITRRNDNLTIFGGDSFNASSPQSANRILELNLLDAFLSVDFSFMFREENEALRDLFNNALADMEKDGTLASLFQESVTPAIFDAEVNPATAGMDPAEGAETIRVAVTGSLPPMDYFAGNGTPAGFNTGIMAEIGRRTGKNIEFVSVDAGARLLALSSGSVDVVFWARNHAEHDTLVNTGAWKALLRDHPDLENSLTEEEEARIRSARDAIFAIRAVENEQPEGTILSRPFYSDWYAYLIRRE